MGVELKDRGITQVSINMTDYTRTEMCIRDRLDRVAEEFIRDNGAVPTFKGFPHQYGDPFPASICTSVNEQVVHGIPIDNVVPVSYTHLDVYKRQRWYREARSFYPHFKLEPG